MTNRISKVNQKEQDRDRELVERMLAGNEAAYRDFVDLYKDRLFACMLAHTGCRHDAEEIVQESFIKVFLNLSRFQHQSQLYTWIYRIAWNTCASRIRKNREEVSLEFSGANEQSPAPESLQPHIPMERLERVTILRRALSSIESRHRKILLLREFDERSYQEIAAIMGIPLGTVRSRLSRARDRLKAELVSIGEGADAGQLEAEPSSGTALAV